MRPRKKWNFYGWAQKRGLKKKMIDNFNENGEIIKFQSIFSGKLRRYFSFKNFSDLIRIKLGFFQSIWIIFKYKPDIILTAGSFIAVPVVWAGWILRVPILVHQQDVKVGLANKLMAPFAKIITCSLERSTKDFKNKKTYFTGNFIRKKIFKNKVSKVSSEFDFKNNLKTVLVLGGGTGAEAVNTIIVHCIPSLTKFCNIIHITGGKTLSECLRIVIPSGAEGSLSDRYRAYPFLNNIEEVYSIADLVITRAGMGILSELTVLAKPVIIIPIPDSHQTANAKYFADHNAAIVLDQKKLTPDKLTETIKNLLSDKNSLKKLSDNISKIMPADGAERIAGIILEEIKKQI
ncbi:MAG: UDP-N-acetylglucosamine--N-acetylmuramyl-(pentapeptide) pyrophosphoryl-undecaprenol N-acetylglucosamine transferase [bacterium]